MKKEILILAISLLSILGISQGNRKFDYKFNKEYNSYSVTPLFEHVALAGEKGRATFLDENYVSNLLFTAVEEVVSKNKITSLHSGSLFLLTFSSKGEILKCVFIINDKDINVLSDDDFYNLYTKFKQIKIDTSLVKISPNDTKESTQLRYADIICPLIPKNNKLKQK